MITLLKIKKTKKTTCRQFHCMIEKPHCSVTNYLPKFISKNQSDWNKFPHLFLPAYHISQQEATGYSLSLQLNDRPSYDAEEILLPKFTRTKLQLTSDRRKLRFGKDGKDLNWLRKMKRPNSKKYNFHQGPSLNLSTWND